MTNTQDTEITLGTGKMLFLFFGLVALCGVFFGVGFSLGRGSMRTGIATMDSNLSTASGPVVRPSAVKSNSVPASTSDQPVLQSVAQKETAAPASTDNGSSAPAASENTSTTVAGALPTAGNYFVQVAAVSKQEDADALVEALKKKQYAAFSAINSPTDKLIHVQIGPFGDIKDAEGTRAKLISDGYNPIVKK